MPPMSITTKTGDGGTTSLWSGERVSKDDLRVECYGTVDELSSILGMARHACVEPFVLGEITLLQRCLHRVASELASTGRPKSRPVGPGDEAELTAKIHALETEIALRGFVLPGMTPGSAALDVARTVARRAERRLVALARAAPVSPTLSSWVNRLSDFLFMLARKEEFSQGAIVYAVPTTASAAPGE